MRDVTVDCDLCGMRMPLEQSKEALIKLGPNRYHLLDLCRRCLDDQLQRTEAVNDADGFRQQAAALISPRDGRVAERKGSSAA